MKIGYNTKDGSLIVDHEDLPPCLYCGEPVSEPSMDGPGVCAWCDMGVHRDGREWTYRETMAFYQAGRDRIAQWAKESPTEGESK